ncbi:MAG: hypothetical protein E7420_00585 [Ruminococcaceae bacterium]|nr:hypothetical protein [Oscillospiraceae bacterium]
MIFNMSGGGTSLNFKVVGGTTQPSNPKENTVWVNTDVDIPYWVFAPKNPYSSTKEIYTEVGATADYYINNSGVITQSDAYTLTDMIPLPDGTVSVIITADSNTSTTVSHWFYDVNRNAISHVLRQNDTLTYSVPAGAKFIRASIRDGDAKSIIANMVVPADNGTVVVLTSPSSTSEFNALKKNGIIIHPFSAKQYIGGVWVNKEVQSYQNGEWKDWLFYIYNRGEEVFPLTFKKIIVMLPTQRTQTASLCKSHRLPYQLVSMVYISKLIQRLMLQSLRL